MAKIPHQFRCVRRTLALGLQILSRQFRTDGPNQYGSLGKRHIEDAVGVGARHFTVNSSRV